MSDATLLAISPLDGRYASKTESLREFVSEYGLIRFRLAVEVAWLHLLVDTGWFDASLPPAVSDRLSSVVDHFSVDDAQAVKQIERETNHDVKACEYYLANLAREHGADDKLIALLHFGCTSEDINNLAYAMMLKRARDDVAAPELESLAGLIADRAADWAALPMLSRTHGQTASPTTMGKEFANVLARLDREIATLKSAPVLGKFNGAVGNFNAHMSAIDDVDWPALSKKLIQAVGVDYNAMTTQIEPHDWIAEYLQVISRIATILIDFSRDCWTYISLGYFRQKTVAGEVGSSTMPHKVNPIDFENAEGNLGMVVALSNHLANKLPCSRLQRDLTDSTTLRNLGTVLGYLSIATASLAKGIGKLQIVEAALEHDLEQSWEVLAEPLQTVMRRYGVADAYDQLKALTRGQVIDASRLQEILANIDLPAEARSKLAELSPRTYVGLAAQLTHEYLSKRGG
ncbi:MAG: adenylosuccinate lyase [Pseudomonadota bacterium]